MLNQDSKKRIARNPLKPEEVAEIVAFKKYKQQVALIKFKTTKHYKYMNAFCIISFFIYCQFIICFFGPCHFSSNKIIEISEEYNKDRTEQQANSLYSLKIYALGGKFYEAIINDRIDVPNVNSSFLVGKDFLFQKEINVKFDKEGKSYRIKSAEPLMFLSCFVGFLMLVTFFYNLNQNPNSLNAITLMNAITVLCLLLI